MNFPFSFLRISGCSAFRILYLDNLVLLVCFNLISNYLTLISLNINFHNDSIRLNCFEYIRNSDGLDWRLQNKNQALLTEKMTHNSTYIGSCHILLLQLLQSQHLSTTRVRGVGYPGVVRHVIITGSRNRINLFNDGESLYPPDSVVDEFHVFLVAVEAD